MQQQEYETRKRRSRLAHGFSASKQILYGIEVRLKDWLLHEEKGVTSLEYGIIGALVAVILAYSYINLGNILNTLFVNAAASL